MTFSPARIFSDYMVLQQGLPVPVWGTAAPGDTVTAAFAGQVKTAQAGTDSKWLLRLDPLPASAEPRTLVLSTMAGGRAEFRDVLVGEVWIAGGQSNMGFILADAEGGANEAAHAEFPLIRCHFVPRIPYPGAELEEPGKYALDYRWKPCLPEHAGGFSAVAYYFSRDLARTLNVPVGIVDCSWGGTSASCWMSEAALEADPDLRVYLDEYREILARLDRQTYENNCRAYQEKVARYQEVADALRRAGRPGEEAAETVGPYPWPPPAGPLNFLSPCNLYHSMLRVIQPFGVKGVIFYQGESDVAKSALYARLFHAMIQNWRADWNRSDLPFLFVQLSAYADGAPDSEAWALLREQQQLVARTVLRTAMAVSYDCGHPTNIHPPRKAPVGARLARLALVHEYGRTDVVASGPEFRGMIVQGNHAILTFGHAEGDLTATGGELKGFTVCGEDGRFVPAAARIRDAGTVEVSSPAVFRPVAVRYGWANYAEITLANGVGLPAAPFRTDAPAVEPPPGTRSECSIPEGCQPVASG